MVRLQLADRLTIRPYFYLNEDFRSRCSEQAVLLIADQSTFTVTFWSKAGAATSFWGNMLPTPGPVPKITCKRPPGGMFKLYRDPRPIRQSSTKRSMPKFQSLTIEERPTDLCISNWLSLARSFSGGPAEEVAQDRAPSFVILNG